MPIPFFWLKEYVDVKIPFPELAKKLSGAGLTVETWQEKDGEIIFDPEITPNRPDWMSIVGIAREIAAVTGAKLQTPNPKPQTPKAKNPLPITIKPNFEIVPRITSVIVRNVKVKPSPDWLAKRIKQIGLRPINNLVDITNYVLWIYGNPLHVFDYDKIRGHQMIVDQAKGGERFRSLDGIDYTLPANAIVIKDVGRIIDLPPIKGGENSAVDNRTKNILLHSIVCDPISTRRTSQALFLRSDSSAISERGVDPNGTMPALELALKLILDTSGGQLASEILDHKQEEFKPWTVALSHQKLESVLGIKIDKKTVIDILERLGLHITGSYSVTIPTFRNDLHIEEDLIEEVGRIYGYNNFPKTLPASPVPTTPVAYTRNYDLEYDVKEFLRSVGYSEIYTYSLISEDQLVKLAINPTKVLRIDNPISRDFEYLRPYLLGNLLEGLKLNLPNFPEIKIFELGKTYKGGTLDKATENYRAGAIISGEKFFQAKGDLENLLQKLNISFETKPLEKTELISWDHPGRAAKLETEEGTIAVVFEVHPSVLTRFGVKGHATSWTLNYDLLQKLANFEKKYQPVPKYPAVVENLSLIIPEKVLYGDVVAVIQKTSSLVQTVDLLDIHQDSKTLRLTYLDPTKNLSDKEVKTIRQKIISRLKEKLAVKDKQ